MPWEIMATPPTALELIQLCYLPAYYVQLCRDTTESAFSALVVEINDRKDALKIRVERLHCLHL